MIKNENRVVVEMGIQNQEVISHFMQTSLPKTDTTGKVHSVFKNSFNIMVQEQLFNFSSKAMPLSSHGCLLDKNKIDHLFSNCRVGDVIRISKMRITFYTKYEIIKVDLSQLNIVDLTIPKMKIPIKKITESVLYSILEAIKLEKKLGIDFSDEVKEAFVLLKTPSNYEKNEIKHAIHLLMGRGKGLTPSGDDILMGYLAVEKAFNRESCVEEFIKNEIQQNVTTEISEAYYHALFSNTISSIFLELFLGLESSEEQKILTLLNNIDRYGHTSGNDTLFGIYLGLHSLVSENS